MWKITNNVNVSVFNRYSLFICEIFELLIKLSKEVHKEKLLETEDYLENIFKRHKILDEKLLVLYRSKSDKFKPLLVNIIKLDTKVLKHEYMVFKEQNLLISTNNYNILRVKHPKLLIKLFKDYFYDKFFGVDWIWSDIIGRTYKRSMFKTDFKDENRLYACCYCDTDTISNERNGWIEHFLPKSKFPYVSCNVNNLIPCCNACNVAGSGKGDDFKNPIVTQYTTQIGDVIKFEYKNNEIQIKKNPDAAIENYIELLKLRKRYNEDNVNSRVISNLKNNYGIVLQSKRIEEFDIDVFFEFIHMNGRNNGMYFVQRDLLDSIKEINP